MFCFRITGQPPPPSVSKVTWKWKNWAGHTPVCPFKESMFFVDLFVSMFGFFPYV